MLLTIERVAVLQSVDMFAEPPGFVLASIARILHEVTVQPGETFIREGDVEDTMVVIVDGRVEVRRQGTLIITLGPGQGLELDMGAHRLVPALSAASGLVNPQPWRIRSLAGGSRLRVVGILAAPRCPVHTFADSLTESGPA